MNRRPRASRLQDFFDTYTRDLTAEDLQRLFTRDAREAYKFFTRGVDSDALKSLPADLRVYSSASDDISQALSRRIQSAGTRSPTRALSR